MGTADQLTTNPAPATVRKPLDLTVHTFDGAFTYYDGTDATICGLRFRRYTHTIVAAQAMAEGKRFTDSELNAEYWRSRVAEVNYDRAGKGWESIPSILHRFATTPSYHQENP